MDLKWYAIMMMVLFVALGASEVAESRAKAQCRASYSTSSRTAAEISKICD